MILCEKESELGGILRSEQALPFKRGMYRLAGTYAKFAKDARVEIRLNTEVTRAYVEREAPDANVRHRPLMLKRMDKLENLTVRTGHRALRVTGEDVVCAAADGSEVLVPGRNVICALGQRSRSDTVSALNGTAPFVRVIGDAARVSTVTNAVYWGYHAALDI